MSSLRINYVTVSNAMGKGSPGKNERFYRFFCFAVAILEVKMLLLKKPDVKIVNIIMFLQEILKRELMPRKLYKYLENPMNIFFTIVKATSAVKTAVHFF